MKKIGVKTLLVICCVAMLAISGCKKASDNAVSGAASESTPAAAADGTGANGENGGGGNGDNGNGGNGGNGQQSNENGSDSGNGAKPSFSTDEDEAIAVAKALHAADDRGGITEDSDAYESALYSVGAPTNPAGAKDVGQQTINDEVCNVFTVDDGAGHTETIAASESGKWYYRDQYGDYIPVTLMSDGTLIVGDLPLDSESVLDVAEWMLRKFTGDNACTVEQSGNGLVNGVDCDMYVATNASGKVLGAIAHGPDGEFYYREGTSFLYRLVGRKLSEYWLAEPVSEFSQSALIVYNEVTGKKAESAKSNEAIVIGNESATQYAIVSGGKTVAYVAVTTNNLWYCDAKADGGYHRVVWSAEGASAS